MNAYSGIGTFHWFLHKMMIHRGLCGFGQSAFPLQDFCQSAVTYLSFAPVSDKSCTEAFVLITKTPGNVCLSCKCKELMQRFIFSRYKHLAATACL